MDKKKVTVFGAGVSGLTAAHELVIRGFDVTIYDPEITLDLGPRTLDRGIGGMARSQFVVDDESPAKGAFRQLRPASDFLRDATIQLDFSTTPAGVTAIPADAPAQLEKIVNELANRGLLSRLRIHLPIATPYPPPEQGESDARWSDPRYLWLAKTLGCRPDQQGPRTQRTTDERSDERHEEVSIPKEAVSEKEQLLRKSIVFTEMDTTENPNLIFFGLRFDVFPAEHGFRFFPSFYRHLFDTMRRTPIEEPRDSEVGRRSVFENLVPVDQLGFGRGGKFTSFLVPRRPVASFEELRQNLLRVFGQLEWTGPDLERFTLKMFKYMTSGTKRRKQYENISWSDFVDLQSYSDVMKEHIEYGPQMMASLRGSRSDARTQGTVFVQLLMDHLREGSRPDATLGGPTSSGWFDHWYDYLRNQGVKFIRGKVTDFATSERGPIPVVDNGDRIEDGYVVFALSLEAMVTVAKRLRQSAGSGASESPDDLDRVVTFLARPPDQPTRVPEDKTPLRHMSGIQFFFDTEVRFWRGHTQYLDSEWGLTSIAQPQFWWKQRNPSHPYRSILSVDIGIWDRETKLEHVDERSRAARRVVKKKDPVRASNCQPDRLAAEVWAQIEDHHDQAFASTYGDDTPFPQPRSFALDQGLSFDEHGLCGNRYLYIVNTVGSYEGRPGALPARSPKAVSHYQLLHDRFVMAGTFMKTFTRITSMEAANESARHAVNAILRDAKSATDRCEIWDPEDFELPDLQYLKELDDALFDKNQPHFVDILGLNEFRAMTRFDVAKALAGLRRT